MDKSVTDDMALSNKCRLCLYENGCLNPIFETRPDTETKRLVKISLCTYLKIEPGDGLPIVICNVCLSFVENWYHFKLKCEQINEELCRQQVKKVHFKSAVKSSPGVAELNRLENLSLAQLGEINILEHEDEAEIAEESDDSLENENDEQEHIRVEQENNINDKELNHDDVEELDHDVDGNDEVGSVSDIEEADDDDIEIVYDAINVQDSSVPENVSTASNIRSGNVSTASNVRSNAGSRRRKLQAKLMNGPKTQNFRSRKNKFGNKQKSKYKCHGCLQQSEDRNDHVCFDNMLIQCDTCSKSFTDRYDHEIHHANKMHKVCKNKCVVCGLFFNTKRELNIHKRNQHKKKNNFICKKCGKRFLSKIRLNDHIKTHEEVQPKLLKKTESLFPEVEILALNSSPSSSAPAATIEIDSSSGEESDNSRNDVRVINRNARKNNAVRRRQQQKTSDPSKVPTVLARAGLNVWCTCSICGEELKMKSVKNHLKAHGIKYGYYCIVCKENAKTLAGLETHLALHFSSKKHFCFQCFQLFNGHAQLAKHKETHGNVLKYVCPVCRQTFKHKSVMVRHAEIHI